MVVIVVKVKNTQINTLKQKARNPKITGFVYHHKF